MFLKEKTLKSLVGLLRVNLWKSFINSYLKFMRLPGYKQGHQNTKEKKEKTIIIKYMFLFWLLPTSHFLIFQAQLQIQRMISCPASTAWHCSQSQDSTLSFSPMLCPCKTCPHPVKGGWLARDRHRMHPDSSIFFPFHFLCDSWNVFAHGGKNAERREKQPGTSPSLAALSSGVGSLCQHR